MAPGEQQYIASARDAGYDGPDEVLTRVGMAIELGSVAWSWYESGNDKFDVAAIFKYRDETPNYESVIGAYAEGAFSE